MLKHDGVSSPATYAYHVVCFFVGRAALWLFTLDRVKVDHSEGPNWNPFSRLPDGSPAISESSVSALGFVVHMAGLGLVWLLWTLM